MSNAAEPESTLEQITTESEVLPASLRAQYIAKMEQFRRNENETSPTAPVAEASAESAQPAAESASAPEPTLESASESRAQSAQSETDSVAALQAELAAMREELRRAQARYDTLRGKYDTELAILRNQLAMTSVPPQSAPSQPAASSVTADTTQSFREILTSQYGQEFDQSTIDFVARAAALAHERAVAALQDRLTKTEQYTNLTRQQALELQLDSRIPGWREIASDPRFAAWLSEADPFSGLIRREVLAKAVERADADRLAVVFETYRRSVAESAEAPAGVANGFAPAGSSVVTGAAPSPKPRLPPSAAVAPPRPRGPVAATSASAVSPVTAADLRAYAARIRRGEATDEEFNRLRDAMLSGQYTG